MGTKLVKLDGTLRPPAQYEVGGESPGHTPCDAWRHVRGVSLRRPTMTDRTVTIPVLTPKKVRGVQKEPADARDLNVKKPFYGAVRIDPEMAAVWADLNIGNRRCRRTFVNDIARMITNNEWQPDHPQPIVFSSEGVLIDGQHRIHAILKANKAITATVLCGVRPGVREYLDLGISRTLDDRIQFSTNLNSNKRIASIVSAFAQIAGPPGRKHVKLTPEEAHETFAKHRKAILFAESIMSSGQRGVCRAYVMVALAELFERDEDLAERFGRSILSPDGEIQAARILRDCLVRISQSKGGMGGQAISFDAYHRAVSCCKAALEGRTISTARCGNW